MKIWLIGGGGMLGQELARLLGQIELTFLETDIEVDITRKSQVSNFVKKNFDGNIDWIINCSGYTAVDQAEDEPDKAFAVNAEGVGNLAEICLSYNANLIHISTDYVFDGSKKTAYTETDETHPIGVYGTSKLHGERAIIDCLSRYYILRTSWLYGLYGRNFVATMLRLFEERDLVKVVSDQWGSPTYTYDLAQMILILLRGEGKNFGIYNFSNEGKTNWYEFAKAIYHHGLKQNILTREVQIVPISTEEFPTKARRPQNSHLSKAKIKRNFGVPIRSWQEALEDFLDKYKKGAK